MRKCLYYLRYLNCAKRRTVSTLLVLSLMLTACEEDDKPRPPDAAQDQKKPGDSKRSGGDLGNTTTAMTPAERLQAQQKASFDAAMIAVRANKTKIKSAIDKTVAAIAVHEKKGIDAQLKKVMATISLQTRTVEMLNDRFKQSSGFFDLEKTKQYGNKLRPVVDMATQISERVLKYGLRAQIDPQGFDRIAVDANTRFLELNEKLSKGVLSFTDLENTLNNLALSMNDVQVLTFLNAQAIATKDAVNLRQNQTYLRHLLLLDELHDLQTQVVQLETSASLSNVAKLEESNHRFDNRRLVLEKLIQTIREPKAGTNTTATTATGTDNGSQVGSGVNTSGTTNGSEQNPDNVSTNDLTIASVSAVRADSKIELDIKDRTLTAEMNSNHIGQPQGNVTRSINDIIRGGTAATVTQTHQNYRGRFYNILAFDKNQGKNGSYQVVPSNKHHLEPYKSIRDQKVLENTADTDRMVIGSLVLESIGGQRVLTLVYHLGKEGRTEKIMMAMKPHRQQAGAYFGTLLTTFSDRTIAGKQEYHEIVVTLSPTANQVSVILSTQRMLWQHKDKHGQPLFLARRAYYNGSIK